MFKRYDYRAFHICFQLNISDESKESVEDGDTAATDPENVLGDRTFVKRSSLGIGGSTTPEVVTVQSKSSVDYIIFSNLF